jgi:TRAP-type C4-dicarboxylate transport system permease small subunit
MSTATRTLERVVKALMVFGALWSFGLAFYILFDVACRALGIKGVPGTAEIARNSIVMIVFMQLPYCVLSKGMLQADFLVHWLPPGLQRGLRGAGYVGGALLFAALAVGSWHPALEAWLRASFDGEGAFRMPIWPVRFTILFGCALSALCYLQLMLEELRGRTGSLAAEHAADGVAIV